MMKYIKKHGILLSIIILTGYNSVSQSFNETIKFADQQFKNKNYQLAVKEYQRALLFSQGRRTDYLYRQIANAFFVNKQFEQAQYFYELSYKTCSIDSIKNEMSIKKVQCFLLLKKFRKALIELYNLPDNISDYYLNRKHFYLAISYYGLHDFEKSERYFLQIVNDSANKQKISKLLHSKKLISRPNPKTAKILSMISPGLGQIYAGDIKNGLNSSLLIGGLAFLGGSMAVTYSFLDSVLTVIPWFVRYYQGGYTNAYSQAYKKRLKRRQKTFLKILEIIKNDRQLR